MNHTLVENQHGHGALPSPLDLRDFKYKDIAMAAVPFNWEVGFDSELSPVKTKDQNGSFSCGGQASAYLSSLINKAPERSAKYVYSQIFYPQGGTTIRDVLDFHVKHGDADESLVPSYDNGHPPQETFMHDTSLNSLGDASAVPYEATGYAFVNTDIESFAQAIRDNDGMIMQIAGQNNGTWNSTDPLPPGGNGDKWSHFLVCTGAMLRNGKKVIKVHNSWGDSVGENGYQYISEDYFKSGNIEKGGVIYHKENPIITEQKITLMTKIIALLQQLIHMKQAIGGWFS